MVRDLGFSALTIRLVSRILHGHWQVVESSVFAYCGDDPKAPGASFECGKAFERDPFF